jgi:uncharacterized protein YbjT (DUF2867 family)
MQKTAILFGATGLVGACLVRLLCEKNHFTQVISFSRKPCGYSHPKLNERISDLRNVNSIASEIKGDDLFCCLGTTIKKAGNKENFRKVDFDLPLELAKIAAKNQFQNYLVVSSIGADANASNFYLRTKGQMEQEVMKQDIPSISIVRPSMLLGPRQEFRFGETAGKVAMKLINPLMFGRFMKYRGIHANDVAKAMLTLATQSTKGANIFESDELQRIANKH